MHPTLEAAPVPAMAFETLLPAGDGSCGGQRERAAASKYSLLLPLLLFPSHHASLLGKMMD